MSDAPDLFMAHLYANNVSLNLLQAHSLLHHSGQAVLRHRNRAMEELDKLAEMLGLELVPRTEVVTR